MATRFEAFNKAAGFINMSITGKDGTIHRLKVGVPLHADRGIDAAILATPAVLQDAMKDGRIAMSVHVIANTEQKAIVL